MWAPLFEELGLAEKKESADAAAPATETAAAVADAATPAGAASPAPAAVSCRIRIEPCTEAAVDAESAAIAAVASHAGGHVFSAPAVAARKMTSDDAIKQVWHLELNVAAGMKNSPVEGAAAASEEAAAVAAAPSDDASGTAAAAFEPGDSIGLICHNRAEDIAALCDRLSVLSADSIRIVPDTQSGATAVPSHLPTEVCCVGAILKYCCDINLVTKKTMIKALACYAADAGEKEKLERLVHKDGRADWTAFIDKRTTLLELLRAYPSAHPPLALVLDQLSPLAPRHYSISSSPLNPAHSAQVHFAFSAVEYTTPPPHSVPRTGLATSILADLCGKLAGSGEAFALPIFFQPASSFHLPAEDDARPLILIGPGTGVAPFVVFPRRPDY